MKFVVRASLEVPDPFIHRSLLNNFLPTRTHRLLAAMVATISARWAVAALMAAGGTLQAQRTDTSVPQPLNETLLARVDPAYRDQASQHVRQTESQQGLWANLPEEQLTASVAYELTRSRAAVDFLLARLDAEKSAKVRSMILQGSARWGDTLSEFPQAEPALQRRASSDPDASVALLALERLRSARMAQLARLLDQRLESARTAGDTPGLALLGAEEGRWFGLKRGTTLPGFYLVPPPAFEVVAPDKPIRVVAFGDFGTGSEGQRLTAGAIREHHERKRFDFGITMGDNFYSRGMLSPDDSRWKTQWEDMYGPLGIRFYAVLGNHDWIEKDSPAAEIIYSGRSASWRMPAAYYTYTAGPAQFFALDTELIGEQQLAWLDRELGASKARWKIVYAHYHMFSATRGTNSRLIERLLPLLKQHKVDVYLCGHDHNLQELKPEGSVHFFVAGGAGAGLYELNTYDRAIYGGKKNGFAMLEADQDLLAVSLVGSDGATLHRREISRR